MVATCGATSSSNFTYFTNPGYPGTYAGYPGTYAGGGRCTVSITKSAGVDQVGRCAASAEVLIGEASRADDRYAATPLRERTNASERPADRQPNRHSRVACGPARVRRM